MSIMCKLFPRNGFPVQSVLRHSAEAKHTDSMRTQLPPMPADEVLTILSPLWPDHRSALNYGSCFQLLVAVVLSAQCTDEQVNRVTPALFAIYPDAQALAGARLSDVERLVHSTGFYHAKARNIIASAQQIVHSYGGAVPEAMEALLSLPGVGRKTANLVRSVCFGLPGIIVDTHVLRIARRLGIAPTDDPAKSERMIAASLPQEQWTRFSNVLNRHAKYVCTARKPHCAECPLAMNCPSTQPFDQHR